MNNNVLPEAFKMHGGKKGMVAIEKALIYGHNLKQNLFYHNIIITKLVCYFSYEIVCIESEEKL